METIQKMYRVNRIVSDDRLIGLQNWYNQVIMKQPDELDLKDVSIMIRQRLFLKTAVNKAIAFLEKDPLIGEMYQGQLLVNFSTVPSNNYVEYREKLFSVLKKSKKSIDVADDLTETEKKDIIKAMQVINVALKEQTDLDENELTTIKFRFNRKSGLTDT